MRDKIFKHLTEQVAYISLGMMFLFACTILYYNHIAGGICFLVLLCFLVLFRKKETSKQTRWENYIENIASEFDGTLKHALINHPLPLHIMDSEGEVIWYNKSFAKTFGTADILHSKITNMVPGFKLPDAPAKEGEEAEKNTLVTHDGKIFKIISTILEPDVENNTMIYWTDVTNYESLKIMYKDERICTAYMWVDNYEDLIAGTSDDKKSSLVAQIDGIIRQWAAKYNILLIRYEASKYYVIMENKYFEQIEATKFSLLDEIREVETQTDFPVSLSIGIGIGGRNIIQTGEYADTALDLALGRGGDQAVVKKITRIEYYGGKLQAVERRNKGKSKIMAHALRQLIDQSQRVLIMGHRDPDMDSFGAALGIYNFAAGRNKEVSIVISKVNDSLENIFQVAQETKQYSFISEEQALMSNKDMLLVVVDTHKPSLTECPPLLNKADKIVVIDHHRKMEESIENATLIYMEPYASSASELVAEILQYSGDKKGISKLEADALLAGITVDTKNFSVRTGVRTFEVASWLRRAGADTITVRQYFQSDLETFKLRAEILARAEMISGGIMMSIVPQKRPFMNLITAQSADQMLDIRNVKASFVLGMNEDDKIVISARSLSSINVQLIMEKMGGGGHLTAAGAQVQGSMEEVKQQLEQVISEMLERETGK